MDTLSSKLSVCTSYTQQPSPHTDGNTLNQVQETEVGGGSSLVFWGHLHFACPQPISKSSSWQWSQGKSLMPEAQEPSACQGGYIPASLLPPGKMRPELQSTSHRTRGRESGVWQCMKPGWFFSLYLESGTGHFKASQRDWNPCFMVKTLKFSFSLPA